MVRVDNDFGGFCTHSSILFLTWHRPYLAIFETELYKHVNFIANAYTEDERKADYVKAAKTFRMPYWDWARPDLGVFPPQAASAALNKVVRPKALSGKSEINPLSNYTFRESASLRDINTVPRVGATVRYPNIRDGDAEINRQLLAFFQGEQGSPKGKNLTERISSFDPIFWLHHANIDRLFAIWQAIHDKPSDPLTYVTTKPSDANWGNFIVKAGDPEGIDTPLAPFAQSSNGTEQKFWTSEGVRTTEVFGYAYPETQKARFPTPKDVINELDRLYGKMATFANIMRSSSADLDNATQELQQRAKNHIKAERGQLAAASVEQAPLAQTNGVHLPKERELKKLVGAENKYLEWLVNIKAEKAQLGGNYVVHVFLGDVDDASPLLYPTQHSHVGVFATFGQNENTACRNCQEGRARGQQITGQIPITLALVERYLAGMVDSLAPADVIPYLQKNLHWRVALVNGEVQDRQNVGNLLVSVVTDEVTIPSNPSDLPVYAPDVVVRPDCTTNRQGSGRGHGTGYSG
uniref:tyrosinase n=1 Tax=Colletotrichum fructicola (strain Nara gc5) TaxID=1213859 RepID=L2GER5_COLFN